jgi:hypothetical protein
LYETRQFTEGVRSGCSRKLPCTIQKLPCPYIFVWGPAFHRVNICMGHGNLPRGSDRVARVNCRVPYKNCRAPYNFFAHGIFTGSPRKLPGGADQVARANCRAPYKNCRAHTKMYGTRHFTGSIFVCDTAIYRGVRSGRSSKLPCPIQKMPVPIHFCMGPKKCMGHGIFVWDTAIYRGGPIGSLEQIAVPHTKIAVLHTKFLRTAFLPGPLGNCREGSDRVSRVKLPCPIQKCRTIQNFRFWVGFRVSISERIRPNPDLRWVRDLARYYYALSLLAQRVTEPHCEFHAPSRLGVSR